MSSFLDWASGSIRKIKRKRQQTPKLDLGWQNREIPYLPRPNHRPTDILSSNVQLHCNSIIPLLQYLIVIIYDINQMLSRIIKNTFPIAIKKLQLHQLFMITAPKSLSSKKKKIYQSQSTLSHPELINKIEVSPEDKKSRLQHIEQMFYQFGKQTLQLYKTVLPIQRKNEDIKSLFLRHHSKIAKQCQILSPSELINYIEIIKNINLTKLQFLQQVQVAYSELQNILKRDQQLNVLKQHFKTLWSEEQNIQTRIRSLCLIQYVDQPTRTEYLKKVTPLVQYFKTTQILIVMYEKWKYKYNYHYEFIDQIHQNQTYYELEDINLSYYKMLFLESIKGQFIPNDDGVYNKIFHSFIDRPNVLNHSAFNKFVKMLHSQLFFLQTQFTRYQLQMSLNTFVNIAKNQNYDKNVMNLDQLVQIYLGFEEVNSTGQILLSEITFFSKTYNFKINKQNFSLYKKLMKSVLKNIEKKIKYQRRDSLNKSYTMDTINFLNEFLPKYIEIQPTIILDVNQASRELFIKSQNGPILLKQFQQTFKQLTNEQQQQYKISLENIDFTLRVLRFVKTFKDLGQFSLNNDVILRLLKQLRQFKKKDKKNVIRNEEIEALYWILSLYEKKPEKEHRDMIASINAKVIEKQMSEQLKNSQQNNLVISLDHNIVWLSLCSAKIRSFHIQTNDQILQNFINKKLFYLINSLQYRQVYDILVFTLNRKHIKMEVYQRLLYNLSTFIIYIDEKKAKNTKAINPFYLNDYYADLYVPICKLILEHKLLFKKIQQKEVFKILQIIMMKYINNFNNKQILELLFIIGSPEYLTISVNKYLEQLKFPSGQLQRFDYVNYLKDFEYYNRSISKYFQGKYSQKEIKNKLKHQIMTPQELEECFQNFEVYKTIFMDGELITRFEIPEPKTNIVDYKSLFICERIFKKIKQNINFDFQIPRESIMNDNLSMQTTNRNAFSMNNQTPKTINLQYESNYIKKEILQLQKSQNELRIPNRMLPKYLKVEVWKNFSFFNKNLTIDPKDLFSNKKLTDQILTKIVKSVHHESLEKMKEVLRQFSCREELVEALKQQNIVYQQHGAALHFSPADTSKKEYILLCSQNSNYKILYICAYFLQRQGFDVAILKSDDNTQNAISYLKKRFATQKKQIQPKVEQGEIQQEQQ